MSKTCGTTRERKPMVHILLKKEKRSRRVRHTIRYPKVFRGVLRFDGHLTGAIYCSKKHGKVHPNQVRRLTNSTASLERR